MLSRASHFLRTAPLAALFVAVFFFVSAAGVSAATVYANYATGNDTTGDGSSGNPYKTFNKAYTAASSGDTINLNGTFDWSNTDETGDAATTGYTIGKSLTIIGQSASSTIIQASSTPSSSTSRVFTISTNVNVTFQDLTIRYGRTTTANTSAAINDTGGGSLTIRDAYIYNNDGSGNFVSGGIYTSGPITVDRSTFDSNTGGYVNALYAGGATTITNSTFFNNTGGTVGGLYLYTGASTITNSLVASSSVLEIQGSQNISVKNSILLGTPNGNAIYYYNFFGTVTDNGTNIVAGETGTGGSIGPFFTNGVNGTSKVSNATTLATLNIATSLADNGSGNGVQTLALQSGSQAVNGGTGGMNGSASVPAVDGRNLYRDSTPDIGAYEYSGTQSAPTFSAPSTAASSVSVGSISQASTTISWTSGNGAARAVFMKEGTSGDAAPVNNTTYTPNTAFGSGTQIGSTGWYAVYNGSGSSVTVSNLSYAKNYRVHVVEYNGYAGGETYQTSGTTATTTKSAYAGTTIYANYTSGSDSSGAGSSGNPYKTFNKAYTQAIDGDTLNLTGTFNWANADETGDAATTGYTLNKSLTITGQGAGATLIEPAATDNTASARVFTISSTAATTTIQNVTLRYGKTSTGGCLNLAASTTVSLYGIDMLSCRSTSSGGGGIYTNAANVSLTVASSSMTGNSASTLGYGGGIFMSSTGGTLTVTDSTLTGNTANGASYGGAAVYFSGTSGNAYFTNDTLTQNYAYNGTIYTSSATVTFKNTILSGNVSSGTANLVNLYRSAGSYVSNGYNIFGIYSTTHFNATTTGDWADPGGSGTFTLYGASTTGTLGLAATSTSENGTIVAALQTGSIGINQGSSAANGPVSVPTLDQRGGVRAGVTDIGAYEYGGIADTTAPTVSLTAPTSSATVAGASVSLSATASDNVAVAGVTFYVDNTKQGSEDTTSPYSISWDSTATSTGAHSAFAVARDTSNNYATSTSVSFTVDNTPPVISAIATSTATTTATITWTTDEAASSLINFGLTTSYGTSTAETDTSPRVTSHSVTAPLLSACTQYHYQVQSKDASANTATSSDATFLTLGCTGSATVSASGQGSITTAAGGTVTQGVLTLTVPVSFTATSSSAVFQANQLNGTTFFSAVSDPSGKSHAGTTVFHLVALTDATTTLSTFAAPITVTLSYTSGDISGLDESSLKIYRYDGSAWSALASCTVNTSAKTVTCTTTNFSDFAIFGSAAATPAPAPTTTTSGGNGPIFVGNLPDYIPPRPQVIYPDGRIVYLDAVASSAPSVALGNATTSNPTTLLSQSGNSVVRFTRTLRPRETAGDVRALQEFLNTHGFSVASSDAGSPGNESDYFGTRTELALKKFQEAHTQEILVPLGLSHGTGIFGPSTRTFVNTLIAGGK